MHDKALKNFGITKNGDAWTFKFVTSKPQPFPDENFKGSCQGVEAMHAKLGLLCMLVKAQFKEHVIAFKHTLGSLYHIEDYLGIREVEGDAGEPLRVRAKEKMKKKEDEETKKEKGKAPAH
ncbi:unnamed protein product [Amaranthus hypochondriacus]